MGGGMTVPSPASKEALHFQPKWCRVTLASIGDAVITTDNGGVTFLNPVAQSLTGWTLEEAAGQQELQAKGYIRYGHLPLET